MNDYEKSKADAELAFKWLAAAFAALLMAPAMLGLFKFIGPFGMIFMVALSCAFMVRAFVVGMRI